jgi:hypothetical protein
MSDASSQPHRQPWAVSAVVGSFALLLGMLIQLSGALRGTEASLLAGYRRAGFDLAAGLGQPWWGLLVLAAVVYGMALLLLHIPGIARRVMLGLTALVLVAAASLVLAVWGVFWSPLVALLGGAWSAFCASLWAWHNPMPCETIEEPSAG